MNRKYPYHFGFLRSNLDILEMSCLELGASVAFDGEITLRIRILIFVLALFMFEVLERQPLPPISALPLNS